MLAVLPLVWPPQMATPSKQQPTPTPNAHKLDTLINKEIVTPRRWHLKAETCRELISTLKDAYGHLLDIFHPTKKDLISVPYIILFIKVKVKVTL
jgi:hypothetical protein